MANNIDSFFHIPLKQTLSFDLDAKTVEKVTVLDKNTYGKSK